MGRNDGYYPAILPSNIVSGTFVQSAADNADYLQDTLDGNEIVHMMNMAFCQGVLALTPKNLVRPAQNFSKVRRRALKSAYELAFTMPEKSGQDFPRELTAEK